MIIPRLLVPHLFVFQAQIAVECLLKQAGYQHYFFPWTCLANVYRGIMPIRGSLLLLWHEWVQARTDDEASFLNTFLAFLQQDVAATNTDLKPIFIRLVAWFIVPLGTALLWIYSTFVFVPFYWFPLWRQQKRIQHLESMAEGLDE